MTSLIYAGNKEDDEREWRLIHARDDQLKRLIAEGHTDAQAALQQARIDCDKCGQTSAMAVRCKECGDWLQPADDPNTDRAEAAIIERDARIVADFAAAKNHNG